MFYILNLVRCQNGEVSYYDHNDLADHCVTGCYPGEGHEALHAQACGAIGEGHSFHEHEQRYGPLHELNGEFFDGHSRLEHQEMYKNNGGLNEHANVGGVGSAGWNDAHWSKHGAAMGGYAGGLGAGWGGAGWGGNGGWGNAAGWGANGGWGDTLGGEAHGRGGFAHGDGRGSRGGWGANDGWGGPAGWGGNGGAAAGWAGNGAYGLGGGANGWGDNGGAAAGWAGNGAYGLGPAGWGGNGWNGTGFGRNGGWNGGTGAGYGGLGAGWGRNGSLVGAGYGGVGAGWNGGLGAGYGGVGRNLFGRNGGFGAGWNGAGWGWNGGWGGSGWIGNGWNGAGRPNGRDMLDDSLTQANSVEHNHAVFAPDGLLTPARGELQIGGATHSTIDGVGNGYARFYNGPEHALYHNLKGQNTPANVVDFYEDTGVVDPVTGQFVGGYMHPGTFSGVARQNHKALEIARNIANGNGFRKVLIGENPFERMHGHYGHGSSPFEGASPHSALRAAANGILTSFDGAKPADLLYQQEKQAKLAARQVAINNDLRSINGLQGGFNGVVRGINGQRSIALSLFDAKRLEAVKHFQAAQINIQQGNMGRAIEHMKRGKIIGMEARLMALDGAAMQNFMRGRNAAKRGDMVSAKAFEAAGTSLHTNAHVSAEAYANSVGLTNHHSQCSILFGGARHAANARAKALEAEKLRTGSRIAMSTGDCSVANAMTAAAAVASATGRAENEFGKKLNLMTQKQKDTAQMDFFENVQDENVKEAIAHQDNMHRITTGNGVAFNQAIAETISDINLKHIAGVHNKAHAVAGQILEEIPADQFVASINLANVVKRNLKPPSIQQALVIANADEIALGMIADEERRIRAAQAIARANAEQKELKVKRVATTPMETLGIIGSIPEDADIIKLVNANFRLPFRGYQVMIARTAEERDAIEAQNRLRDDLRGKVTRVKFDSHLNVLRAGEGWLNLPESAEKIKITIGRAYFNTEAKAKMEHDGFSTDMLTHVINTGERTDMAAGMDYYIADLSGYTIDLPTAHNPHPVSVAYGTGQIISLQESENIQVDRGSIDIIPWNIFKKNIRPKVNQAIVVVKPSKEAKAKQEKIEKLKKKADKIVKEDEKMLENIALTRKKIIINPDGSSFIEMKPPYGVTELVRVEDAQNIIPSNYVKDCKGLEYGQNGVSEVKGETEERECLHKGVVQKIELKNLTTEFEVQRAGLASAIADRETSFVINKENAFNKKVKGPKQTLLKKAEAGKTNEEIKILAEDGGLTLTVNQGDKKTAFEKLQRLKVIERDNEIKLITIEDAEMADNFAFEIRLHQFKSSIASIHKMSDLALIRLIERYTEKSIEEMHEFDFMFLDYNFYASRKVLLDRIKRFGFDYIEWRNFIKKYLKTNIILAKRLGMNKHQIYSLMTKIQDEWLNAIRAFIVLPFDSDDVVKQRVQEAYNATIKKLRLIFAAKSELVLEFIRTEIENIEHMQSTEGGTIDHKTKTVTLPVQIIEEYTDYIDPQGRKVTQKKNSQIRSEMVGNFIKKVYTDKMGQPHQVCVMETDKNNQLLTTPSKKIIFHNNLGTNKCSLPAKVKDLQCSFKHTGDGVNAIQTGLEQQSGTKCVQKVHLTERQLFEIKKSNALKRSAAELDYIKKQTEEGNKQAASFALQQCQLEKERKKEKTKFDIMNSKPITTPDPYAAEKKLMPLYVPESKCPCI